MNKKGFTLIELICLILALSISVIIVVLKITETIDDYKKENYNVTVNLIKKSIELEIRNNPDFKLTECDNKKKCMSEESNNKIFDMSDVSSYDIYISSIKEKKDSYTIKLNTTSNGKYSGLVIKDKTITIKK